VPRVVNINAIYQPNIPLREGLFWVNKQPEREPCQQTTNRWFELAEGAKPQTFQPQRICLTSSANKRRATWPENSICCPARALACLSSFLQLYRPSHNYHLAGVSFEDMPSFYVL
jgi:hypothetical protein